MKNLILKAILKGINEGLANFDMDDYEADDNIISLKKVIYDDKDTALRILYTHKMVQIMSKNIFDITREEIFLCVEWHNQYSILYNPHLDGEEFKKFVRNIIKIAGGGVNLNWIDTSDVTDMSGLFKNTIFNGDISKWDTSNVVNMHEMFYNAEKFNRPIRNWNVSNVTDMSAMFTYANKFNLNINNWNVSSVVNMRGMFSNTKLFNKPLDAWNTSNVTSMRAMFLSTSKFDLPIGSWNVSNVTDMSGMFLDAATFNLPIGNWDTSNVENMSYMFYRAKKFDQDIRNWNIDKCTSMTYIYKDSPILKRHQIKLNET